MAAAPFPNLRTPHPSPSVSLSPIGFPRRLAMWRTSSRGLSAELRPPPPATAFRGAPIRHLRHFPASPSLESIHLGLAQRWAAAAGEISANGMILTAALYFWQIPHFMALVYLCRNDYAADGFKMFSLADASGQRTALVAFRNCLYMLPLGYVAYDSFSFYRDRTTQKARRMFHATLLYLTIFMAGMMFQLLPNTCTQQLDAEESECLVGSAVKIETSDSSDNGNVDEQKKRPASAPRSPVSYASIAPFPFLPAPSYVLLDV